MKHQIRTKLHDLPHAFPKWRGVDAHCIFDSGLKDTIFDCLRDSEFLGTNTYIQFTSEPYGSADEWEPTLDIDSLEKWEATLCDNAYSVAFHTLWPEALTMLRSDVPFDVDKNPIMMKVERLRLREKLLSVMDEVNKKTYPNLKYERVKFTEEEAMEMVREGWELERKERPSIFVGGVVEKSEEPKEKKVKK